MLLRTSIAAFLVLAGAVIARAEKPSPTETALDEQYTGKVLPFLESYCVSCHSGTKPEAQFDLSPYSSLGDVVKDHGHWALVLEKLEAKEMPPAVAKEHPTVADRQMVINWIKAVRKNEAQKNAGDPGTVLARRLSNSEYNYSIRDLTGVDIRPAREFPVDPANPAGFDNSGESLSMSPALLGKYLQAAREVANHLVLKPTGLAFAPHPMLVETDRDKYCVNQIIQFYKGQATDFADYFQTSWRYKHRAALGKPNATLADFAAADKVSPKYLNTVWRFLEESKEEVGPPAKVQAMWRALPTPDGNQPGAAWQGCEEMRDYIVKLRRKLEPRFANMRAKGLPGDGQPMIMWRNRQYATHRMKYDRNALQVAGEAKPQAEEVAVKDDVAADEATEEPPRQVERRSRAPDPDLIVPAGERERYEAAFDRLCATFPDAFYVSERGRNYLDKSKDKGRYLSAGFHNLMGYFRDDIPLYELILNEHQQKELDAMWRELDFVAAAGIRTYVQFYLSESGEARKAGANPDSPRTGGEDKEITSEPRIKQVAANYLARAKASESEIAIQAVQEHFDWVNSGVRWVEQARLECVPYHLEALQKFAARAYRRPLTEAEQSQLVTDYQTLRDRDGLSHDDAVRDMLVSVLMSPDFCYRIDLIESGAGVQPLSDYALASRLSYFVWSSMPDEELLSKAASGELRRPEVLAAQAQRMLKDPKVERLAAEFGGNWLDFRRFEELNTVDRERFNSFDNDLRQAMFEEPIRFMIDLFRENRSVLDVLYAKHTFVNPALAKHYGMPELKAPSTEWARVENADQYDRGGLLPMAVFLTKNAPGLRTSPVKRGYWMVKTVLGEHIPPPPAAVPELPRDEAQLGELTLREALAQHREDKSCAACHERFDSLGLVFEGFGPIGERREKDLAGHPVDAKATFPGGSEGTGVAGLRDYVRQHRQDDFIDNLCRKMLAYALGRSLILSDEPAIEEMRAKLAAGDYRFGVLVESIVTSPQFLTKRGPEQLAQAQGE